MKSFDEYNAREQQLVQFNKWADHEGLSLRMSGEFDHSNKDTHMAYLGYVEGQQSKQAEVDELKREMLNKTNEAYADGQKSMRKMIKNNEDELRKNLNNALKTIEIQQRFLDDADGANKILTSQASELQKKYDAMYNAFVVADDCRKEWHRCYVGIR